MPAIDTSNDRRVLTYGHQPRTGRKKSDHHFTSPEAAAAWIAREQPRWFNVYWFRGVWTTEGCPPLPTVA